MKINDNLGIDPVYWGKEKQSVFTKTFEGKASKEKLVEIHKQCVKIAKNKE